MGHWEHRWFHDGAWGQYWITTVGPVNDDLPHSHKKLTEVLERSLSSHLMGNHAPYLPLTRLSSQLYQSAKGNLQLRYIGELKDEPWDMESPGFSLEEIELAQKMIGQK